MQIYKDKTWISNCPELRVDWVGKEKSACGFVFWGKYSKIISYEYTKATEMYNLSGLIL